MQGNEMEEAFAAFLEETEFYEASTALRALARAAFEAGCAAAGRKTCEAADEASEPEKIKNLLC